MTGWGRRKSVAILCASLAFVAAGGFVMATAKDDRSRLVGIFAIVFFGGGVPLSLMELRKLARLQRTSIGQPDTICGLSASHVETAMLALTAFGMALGSYGLRYIKPDKPLVEIASWAGACLFGVAALIITIRGLSNRNTS